MRRALLVSILAACQSKAPADPKAGEGAPAKAEAKAEEKAEPAARGDLRRIGFDDAQPGSVPEGFTPGETNGVGTPATWGVAADPNAPSPPNAFGVLETKNTGQTYNVALLEGDPMADVDLSVWVKAVTGEKDQGGGFAFRAKGPHDYYVARWNPIEKNVKFFVVENQLRDELAKADIDVDATKWHALRLLVEGDRFELFLDDDSVLEIRNDRLKDPGTVGLWTKADAATLFDDFVVTPLQ